MNKNTKNIVIAVVVIVVIGFAVWFIGRNTAPSMPASDSDQAGNVAVPQVPVSETTKVSGSLSKYQNSELGFSVQYPTTWQKGELANGVQFIIPIDQTQVSTVNRLEIDINVIPGKCSFPPVTTVESRGTIDIDSSKLNTISMSNTVQGRSYFNRMYSLEKAGICYFFSFSYVALSPDSKGLTGSNLTQAQNNNKAIKATADAAFTAMVKSFVFVTAPAGQEETSVAPAKK